MNIETAAREKFGEPNKRFSSKTELRFGNKGSVSVNLESGEWFDFEHWSGGVFNGEAVKPFVNGSTRMVVDKYDYVDADGELKYQVKRFAPKYFQPRAFVDGAWREGKGCMDGVERLPYRLPEMLKSDYVIVVEGEKDVEALRAKGLVATTKSGGAKAPWGDNCAHYFADRDVYVIPDNDVVGQQGAQQTCAMVAGVAKSVRFCDVCKDMPSRSDTSDWLAVNDADLLEVLKGFREFDAEELDESFVYATLDADTIKPVLSADDFVESTLIAGAMSVVYGPSNVGKTFFASDLALHVALGRKWRGLDVDQAPALYVAAEGSYGIRNRVAAFRNHNNLQESVPFYVIPVAMDLLGDEEAVERLINTARVKKAGLIVLDTLARVMAGGDENGPGDMGKLIANCDRLREKTKAHVMLIHHTGKDQAKGARGHSSLRAATDTEIEVSGGDGVSVARVTKQRELETGGEFAFSLSVVPLGVNARGKEVTSCVVVAADAPISQRKKRPVGKVQRIVLKALQNVVIEHGQQQGSKRVVSEELWRSESYRLMTGESKHKSTNFRRAADQLIGDEFVGFLDGVAWVYDS